MRYLRIGFGLGCLLWLASWAGGAAADCSTSAPGDNDTVNCTIADDDPGNPDPNNEQTSTVGVPPGADNVTVNVETGASINVTPGGGNTVGVGLADDGEVNNDGSITSDVSAGVVTTTNAEINNNGTINNNAQDGVAGLDDTTVNNGTNGQMNNNGQGGGFGSGVFIVQDGEVNNNGQINGNFDDGVTMIVNGQLNNLPGGQINDNALFGAGVVTGQVNNNGQINNNGQAGLPDEDSGVGMDEGTVNNGPSGQINGNVGDGVSIFVGGTVNNDGQINNNGSDGIEATDSTVINNGQINGNDDDGIELNGGGTVTNRGQINGNNPGGGGGAYGVDFDGPGTLDNHGQINNNNNGGTQVDFDNGDDTFINNPGAEVTGTPGLLAVDMSDGNDQVIISMASRVVGIVDGGGHTTGDTLTLAYASTDPNALNAFAAQVAALNPNGGTLNFNGNTY